MRISDWSSDVCSSDLLKPDSLRFRGLRDLEALGLALARAVGLDAAHALPVTVANRQALLIERYDRTSGSDGAIQRLHQEDFCQAMGYPGELKYEAQGGPRSEEHTSELQSLMRTSYAVFCLTKKKNK